MNGTSSPPINFNPQTSSFKLLTLGDSTSAVASKAQAASVAYSAPKNTREHMQASITTLAIPTAMSQKSLTRAEPSQPTTNTTPSVTPLPVSAATPIPTNFVLAPNTGTKKANSTTTATDIMIQRPDGGQIETPLRKVVD